MIWRSWVQTTVRSNLNLSLYDGIDTNQFKVHSSRAVALSACARYLPVQDIVKRAGWSSEQTCQIFCTNKPIEAKGTFQDKIFEENWSQTLFEVVCSVWWSCELYWLTCGIVAHTVIVLAYIVIFTYHYALCYLPIHSSQNALVLM